MGIVSILLGIILLIVFVGSGIFVSGKLSPLDMHMPNMFGSIKPSVVIIGIFSLIGLIIFLNFLMSGLALQKVRTLEDRLHRMSKHKKSEQ